MLVDTLSTFAGRNDTANERLEKIGDGIERQVAATQQLIDATAEQAQRPVTPALGSEQP